VLGGEARTVAPFRALADERFAPARRFADEATRRGMTVRRTSGDLTSFWLEELEERWRRLPVPLVGMTGVAALNCLTLLAQGSRMKVVFSCEHHAVPGGGVEHRMRGSEANLVRLQEGLGGSSWAQFMARFVPECAAGGHQSEACIRSKTVVLAPGADLLTSWVIAPITNA
jgi:hypothetical protein